MSTPTEEDPDDDVQFVSEGPLRPVLECIDLSDGDDDDDGGLPTENMIEDEIERQKAHVTSTLERLARQVAVEKKERAEKCRAFKERQLSQKAHGQKELAFSPGGDAKRCVDMWLKMPGVRPGVLNSGMGWRRRSAPFPTSSSSTHTCPVINCGRLYDSVPLLEGHLKRFDHSPCDPTINLRGVSSELFACVACGQNFQTQEEWKAHLQSKVSLSSTDGHASNQTCQVIVCFACPVCYLLFYIRDECLQHMSAMNHFSESITLNTDAKGRAQPVPVPRYAKNRLIALCKDVAFRVRCSICHKVLNSHMEAKAHFNVQCRQGCAVAEADKTVAEVMRQLRVHSQCPPCSKVFLSQGEAERHTQQTQHQVEVNRSMGRALLQYSNHCEIQYQVQRASMGPGPQGSWLAKGLETSALKRDKEKRGESVGSPAKRQRLGLGSGEKSRAGRTSERNGGSKTALAWFCECGLRCSDEATASNHLFAINQIFHRCGVCDKKMGEASITRLHMSRFHGGAHLSNFLFHCRKCKVDMPRREDILSHVAEAHSGHTYFSEREVPEQEPVSVSYAKPSTSGRQTAASEHRTQTERLGSGPSFQTRTPREREQRWMCRMCEDVFDSEASVLRHCSEPSSHSFQRFVCAHCPQKFFKEATLRRHCVNEHSGQVQMRFFCGFCDSMQYDTEEEFLEHYNSLHSKDFYRMEEPEEDPSTWAEEGVEERDSSQAASSAKPAKSPRGALCPCMASEKSQKERKATFTQCMKRLAGEGECLYVCAPCGVSVHSYAHIKTHVHSSHAALGLDPTFDVECQMCKESHKDVPCFHTHYHSQHCPLEPCRSRTARKSSRPGPGEEEGSETGQAGEKPSTVGYEGGRKSQNGCGGGVTALSTVKKQVAPLAIKAESNADEMEEVDMSVRVPSDNPGDNSDEEMKRALALSVEEARRTTDSDLEMELALKRSLLEY